MGDENDADECGKHATVPSRGSSDHHGGDEDDADACGWWAFPAAVLTHITLGERSDAERAHRVEHATLPSRGSEGHGTGDCSPCVTL